MIKKIKQLLNKYREIILYVIFGGLTTAVDFVVYYPLVHYLSVNELVAKAIGWIAAVIFAFFTNKFFVFQSKNTGGGFMLFELVKFASTRVASLGIQELLMYLAIYPLGVNGDIAYFATSVIVIILNYLFSKLFVFNKK